ncbi:isochorismatase family protein [Bordetella sp. 2513F-2]
MLLERADCTLLVVDMQARLMPAIHDGAGVLATAARLARAAALLEVPVAYTEHRPDKLGGTVIEFDAAPDAVYAKSHFSAMREPGFEDWLPAGRRSIVLAGCEAHVCVLQTALDLRARGWRVALVADAAGSRKPSDHHAALRRARAAGADIVTAEMAIYEWLGDSRHPRFRELLQLVK